ncbi:MAG TPA: hypothetical protein VN700_14480 [Vicinamibacterales bacterium]|nr:hypothetical protein [Vicinamibacterales bacterium]
MGVVVAALGKHDRCLIAPCTSCLVCNGPLTPMARGDTRDHVHPSLLQYAKIESASDERILTGEDFMQPDVVVAGRKQIRRKQQGQL